MFKPKTPISAISASPNWGRERDGRLDNSSGEWIRISSPMGTTDLRVISHPLGCSESTRSGVSKNPESVPPVRPARNAWVCADGLANPGTARQDKCQPHRRTLVAKHPGGSCLPGTQK